MRYLCLLVIICALGCGDGTQRNIDVSNRRKAERKLFQKSRVTFRPMRKSSVDENDGIFTNPRIVTVDKKAGRYELRWTGEDGKEKVIRYLRADALEAFVEASVQKSDSKYVFKYLIRNLTTSPSYVGEFIVQTLSGDIKNERVPAGDDLFIGTRSQLNPKFSEGVWRVFAPLGEENWIYPGISREFQLTSVGKPGLVKCYAGAGDGVLKGVGEDVPSEIVDALPSSSSLLASCLTLGPVERLASLTETERMEYILDKLPLFVEAGWMSDDTQRVYERLLEMCDLEGALEQAKFDLQNGYITNEVFYIIEGLNE